ncbi:MAG: DUF58 domain-containing protein [Maricaulis sp.]|jgi:uncharacterized protein (DUF58 family)|nr:DUF58 domain-containing protein [Maricaulis sp.]MAL11056.1 DUF58 domain-containing protein [Maricaulis sp.]HAQ34504.1 DUF58 domain-containing protein [Alphaproteobacteria bacterium]
MASPFSRQDESQKLTRLRQAGEDAARPFPELLADAERIAATVAQGVHGRRQRGTGENFWEYRHHRPEDGAAAVDWRMSARAQRLFVRENEREAASTVWLWREATPSMTFASAHELPLKSDRAAVCLIALASLLTRAGERVAVLGESERARTRALGLERVATRLATGPGNPQAVEAPSVSRYGLSVLASDFLDPVETWSARLSRFAALQVHGVLLRVIDPMEDEFPFKGRTRFEMPEGHETLLFGRAEEAAKTYRRRWAEHGAALEGLARRTGWTIVTHRTDRPATQAVLALYRALSREA